MRRSASEIIRNLESRVALLERQASKFFLSQKEFKKYFGIEVTRKQYQSIMELMTEVLIKEVYKAKNYTLEEFDDTEIESEEERHGTGNHPHSYTTYIYDYQIIYYRWDIAIPFNGVIDGILKILGKYERSPLRKKIVSSLEWYADQLVEGFFNEKVRGVKGADKKMGQAMVKADRRMDRVEDFDGDEVELEDSGFDSRNGLLHLGFYFSVREEMSY